MIPASNIESILVPIKEVEITVFVPMQFFAPKVCHSKILYFDLFYPFNVTIYQFCYWLIIPIPHPRTLAMFKAKHWNEICNLQSFEEL